MTIQKLLGRARSYRTVLERNISPSPVDMSERDGAEEMRPSAISTKEGERETAEVVSRNKKKITSKYIGSGWQQGKTPRVRYWIGQDLYRISVDGKEGRIKKDFKGKSSPSTTL